MFVQATQDQIANDYFNPAIDALRVGALRW